MQSDLYTKSVLSVIALCLVWLCVNGLAPAVTAQADAQRVVIVGWVDDDGRSLVSRQGLRVDLDDRPVPVTLDNRSVGVVLMGIERGGAWDAIQVDANRAPDTQFPGR